MYAEKDVKGSTVVTQASPFAYALTDPSTPRSNLLTEHFDEEMYVKRDQLEDRSDSHTGSSNLLTQHFDEEMYASKDSSGEDPCRLSSTPR